MKLPLPAPSIVTRRLDSRAGDRPLKTDEEELLRGLRRGDEAVYEDLVHRFGPKMLAVARRFLREQGDAEDAVQDSFLRAFRALGSFHGDSRLWTWLYRITVNTCLMKIRARARAPEVSLDGLLPAFEADGHHARPVAAWAESAAAIASRREVRAEVRKRIESLPGRYREVLLLRDIEELDTDETARVLGIRPGAVKVRLHRARQALCSLVQPLVEASAHSSR